MAAVLVLNATPGVDLLLTVSRTAQSRRARRRHGGAGHQRRLRAACAGGGLRPGGAAGLVGHGLQRCSSGPAPPTCCGWASACCAAPGARRRPRPLRLRAPPVPRVSAAGRLPPRPAHQPAEPEGGAVHAGLPAAVHPGAVGAQDAGLPGPGPAVHRAEHCSSCWPWCCSPRGCAQAARWRAARARCRRPAALLFIALAASTRARVAAREPATLRPERLTSGPTMLLSEDHRAVQDAVRAYVQDRIAPKAAEWDKSHHFPQGRAARPGRAGLLRRGRARPSSTAPASTTWRWPSSWRRSPPATAPPAPWSASTTARCARS